MDAPKRPPQSLTAFLWRSFFATGGFVLGAVGAAATFAAWVFAANLKVSLAPVVLFGACGIIVLTTLMHAAYVAHASALKHLPSIRMARPAPSSYQNVKGILLLDPSELFSTDSLVAIYYVEEEEYEAFIGVGRVLIVQDGGLIQIGVAHMLTEYAEVFERVLRNEKVALRRLIVKPYVPVSFYAPGFGGES